MSEELVVVGKIINTHGHKGMVKILPITDFPERFFRMEKVIVDHLDGLKTFTIEEAKEHKNFILLKFKEISDMNSAELLKGRYIKIKEDDLTELPEDTYYIFQLIGLDVYDLAGNYLGKIEEVLETGSNDVYVVQSDTSQKPLLIPALKKVVKTIDFSGRKMIVELLEGLI